MSYQLVIWDFNGTLYDDVRTALCSVNDILSKRNMEKINLETYREYIDTPIIKFYENFFDFGKISFEVIAKEFFEGYERYSGLCRLMPGADRLIDAFSQNGVKQSVCSSSHREQVVSILTGLGIADRFDAIIGASDREAGSKIELAKSYVDSVGAKDILFIGDSLHDFDTAKAIGAKCVLCSAGHQSRQALEKSGAFVFDQMDELYRKLFDKEDSYA